MKKGTKSPTPGEAKLEQVEVLYYNPDRLEDALHFLRWGPEEGFADLSDRPLPSFEPRSYPAISVRVIFKKGIAAAKPMDEWRERYPDSSDPDDVIIFRSFWGDELVKHARFEL